MKSSFIFKLHSFAGLSSGLFILLMSLSGAALVFHDELDHLQQPAFAVQDKSNLPTDSAYNRLRQIFPHVQINSCVLPADEETAFIFSVNDPAYNAGKRPIQVFLHPQSGDFLGSRGGSDDIRHNFMSWLAKFHNSWHLDKTGEWLLGFMALVFLVSIISGFLLYRKNIASVLLLKRSVYKVQNLHQVIAVYALLFNLMIAVTGFWMQRYVFKKEFYQSYDYTPVVKASPAFPFDFDSSLAMVKKQYPDFTPAVIYFAQSSSSKTAIYGSRASNAYIHSKKFADVIMLDSAGGIAKTRLVDENSAADRYDIINSQLHMGRFGGMGIKILYSILGISSALLSITGFFLWRKRRKIK